MLQLNLNKLTFLKKATQYSYEADSTYYFMDLETYDTYELTAEQVDFNKYFIVEGAEVSLMFFEGELLSVSVPEKVELTVAETDPAIKGAPSNQTKDATTDTGLTLRVPQFIEPGEKNRCILNRWKICRKSLIALLFFNYE